MSTSPPTKEQSIIYQVSMYSSLVANKTGPGLEAQLYAAIQAALEKDRHHIGHWSIAWGPVVVQHPADSYAINSMYVAEHKNFLGEKTYVVGIAGTNPSSLFDWLVEDALVSVQIPWVYALLSAPDAKIALGTGIGLAILQSAKPGSGIPGAGTTLLEFLKGIEFKLGTHLVVSGHSLGGALSPTLTLWLHDVRILWDPFHLVKLSTMPTAGPTAGNSHFAGYSDRELSITRFANAIDVVPHAWQASDLAQIPTLYVPDIEPDRLIQDLVAFGERISAGGDYTQLVHDTGWFPFDVEKSLIDPLRPAFVNFFVQLAWQHTVAYLRYFGVVSDHLEAWAQEFQAAAVAAAPAVAAGLAAGAAAQERTKPVAGQPVVIPSGSDPRAREVAARVVEELRRHATPEQQQIVLPIDPQALVDARSGAPQP
ncbi:MAG: lipase family protein [Longimicrobiaceae bacterium]